MVFKLPHRLNSSTWDHMRVGLLGGSFNPPHPGHVHISKIALTSMQLDAVWWLVTPQNPLKKNLKMAAYQERVAMCEDIVAQQPSILVSTIENDYGINRTYDTLKILKKCFPKTEFVWCTGMDNALGFHRWYKWRDILDMVATAHIARPPAPSLIRNCPLKRQSTQRHIYMRKSYPVELSPRHTYWIMQRKMIDISSTEIREKSNKNQ